LIPSPSSLPALDGALESSNGDANGPRLFRLPAESVLQLDLRDEFADVIGDCNTGDVTGVSSSRYGFGFDLCGGNNNSAESPAMFVYIVGLDRERRKDAS
jgi:hypothetical protein